MLPKYNLKEWGSSFLLYGLSYILLVEWLLPLPYITDTGFITLFMLALLAFFIVNFIGLPSSIIFFVKIFVILYGLHTMFFQGQSIWSFEWIGALIADILENIKFLFTGQFLYLTDLFRSLLFFILLAVMSYLLFYWTIRVKRIMFFLVFTVVYITIIDTFTPYDATYPIVRIFIIGFLLLGLVRIYRTMDKDRIITHSKLLPLRLLASLSLVIFLASTLGFLGPKYDPQWEDPVPFMKTAMGVQGGESQRVGYGDNDTQLGGGIDYDETPIFYAYASKGQYWRGETKNYYTGKGWEVSTPPELAQIPFSQFGHEVELTPIEATIEMTGNQLFSHIFYPGEVFDVKTYSGHAITPWKEVYTEKVKTYYREEALELDQYTLHYYDPNFSVTKLREAESWNPEYVEEYYLQLPDDLPDRVRELTTEIIAKYDNRYDQVKAVERYFSREGYRYETKDVAIPGEGIDYVDQFLFDTKEGYCDNFSTSMAVMLRSVGIPTRWVKGFTAGERIATENGIGQYEITSSNAHSWVEVYFVGHGWVPFEPTRGFSNSTFNFEFEQLTSNDMEWQREEREVLEKQEQEEVEPVMAEARENIESDKSRQAQGRYLGYILLSLGVLLIGIMLWIFRKKIYSNWMLRKAKKDRHVKSIDEAYEKVMKVLKSNGLIRQDGETLREFASRIDEQYNMNDMTTFIQMYEQISYGKDKDNALSKDNLKLWENLINKIIS